MQRLLSLLLWKRVFSSLVCPAPVPIHPNSALRGQQTCPHTRMYPSPVTHHPWQVCACFFVTRSCLVMLTDILWQMHLTLPPSLLSLPPQITNIPSAKTMIQDHRVALSVTKHSAVYTTFRGPELSCTTSPHFQPVPFAFFFNQLVLLSAIHH